MFLLFQSHLGYSQFFAFHINFSMNWQTFSKGEIVNILGSVGLQDKVSVVTTQL